VGWVLDVPKEFSLLLKIRGDMTNIYVDEVKISNKQFGELDIVKGGDVWVSFKNGEEVEERLKDVFYDDGLIEDIIRRLRVVKFIKERV
jgi:hypothetical protein